MNQIERAKEYAKKYHAHQVDKAGVDYFSGHVVTVAQKVALGGYSDEYVVVAFLHDIIEDTSVVFEDIVDVFGEKVAFAVKAMTKQKGEEYSLYLERVTSNKIASVVKFYDMEHNSDINRLSIVREKDLKRQAKYQHYMLILAKYL